MDEGPKAERLLSRRLGGEALQSDDVALGSDGPL